MSKALQLNLAVSSYIRPKYCFYHRFLFFSILKSGTDSKSLVSENNTVKQVLLSLNVKSSQLFFLLFLKIFSGVPEGSNLRTLVYRPTGNTKCPD